MDTTVTEDGESDALQRAMAEFFSADSIEELDWVYNDTEYRTHGKYLVAKYLGMEEGEAYLWAHGYIEYGLSDEDE